MKVGILDDNEAICDVISQAILLAGHTSFVYTEAEQLLQNTSELDLLIIDLCLPGSLTGEQVVQRAQLFRADIPIILISAASSYEIHRRTQELTGITILHKPFYMRELIATIENFNQHPSNSDQRQHTTASADAHSRRSHPALYALSESRQPRRV